MSTFYYDDLEDDEAESYEASNILMAYQPDPRDSVNPADEYSYHKYIRDTQGQPLPPPQIRDPQTGEEVLIASRPFQVSLVGEDGPEEYQNVASAADRLTTIWDDAADIRYRLDAQYYTGKGGSYTPINFGVPKYTGDAGYPVIDPNPGNCKPGFLKDQFGRCLHQSWFNLPFAPAGNPWVDISGNSVITNGMSPINGICPNDMFLASNNKCYFFPAPPQTAPPPPPPPAASGSSNYAGTYYGTVTGNRSPALYAVSPQGRIYNTPPHTESFYGYNTVDVQYGAGKINQVYSERKYLRPGDRVILHTNVSLFDDKGGMHLGVVVPDLNFKVSTPEIPVQYPGISEEIETNFIVPEGTEQGDYIGEVQLVKGAVKVDSVNFVVSVD